MTSKPVPEPTRTGGGRCFERLLVIDDPEPRSGPVNMALDEILLNGSPDSRPLLRFYRWASPAVSFGYFEPVAAARRLARGRDVVRRITGGGLVEHGEDLTFTLVVPRPAPFVNLPSAETYRQIHAALASAFIQSSLRVDFHQESALSGLTADDNACFQKPVRHDLTFGGKKIAGGAQRRTRAGLLHQGSILFADAPHAGWTETTRRTLPAALACSHEPRSLSDAEVARAHDLAAAKYATDEWTDRL